MNKFIQAIQNGKKISQFVSLTYKSKSTGELARYTISHNINYRKMVEKSLLELELLDPEEVEVSLISKYGDRNWRPLVDETIQEIKISLNKTVANKQDKNKRFNLYENAGPGLIKSQTDGTFELRGLVCHKIVLKEGEPFPQSSDKAIVKQTIKQFLPIGKFRNFALETSSLKTLKIGGVKIESN